jgi:hypothetical protein
MCFTDPAAGHSCRHKNDRMAVLSSFHMRIGGSVSMDGLSGTRDQRPTTGEDRGTVRRRD